MQRRESATGKLDRTACSHRGQPYLLDIGVQNKPDELIDLTYLVPLTLKLLASHLVLQVEQSYFIYPSWFVLTF